MLADHVESNSRMSQVKTVPDKQGNPVFLGKERRLHSNGGEYAVHVLKEPHDSSTPIDPSQSGISKTAGWIHTLPPSTDPKHGGREEIATVKTYRESRGRGLASKLYHFAQGLAGGKIAHSDVRTRDGYGWSHEVGGTDMYGNDVREEQNVNHPHATINIHPDHPEYPRAKREADAARAVVQDRQF